MFLDDARNHFRLHPNVSDLVLAGQSDFHHRLKAAHADAAGLRDGNVEQVALADLVEEGEHNGTSARGDTAGGHAHDDTGAFVLSAQVDLIEGSLANGLEFG